MQSCDWEGWPSNLQVASTHGKSVIISNSPQATVCKTRSTCIGSLPVELEKLELGSKHSHTLVGNNI